MPSITASGGAPLRLLPLPGAEAESRLVARRMGTEPLVTLAATETAVRGRMGAAAVIHLATHGFAYSTQGDAGASFIALAPDRANDGLLTVSEVVNGGDLKLRADLVVLSACQTGLGNLRQTEGTVGLQRAFLGRGARSVLVSLWNVSDAATRLLMDKFYEHWLGTKEKIGKAEALRRAQDDVRKTTGYEHPRFWAAFQLVGAN
jgi:CHAT domain-containing protein